jgi:Mn2+/Fe2+ NRAMP family transporter
MTIRINRDTDVPVLDTSTEVGYAAAESTLEQALDLASIAAAVTTLAGLTFMLAALAAGWVRTPQQAEQPVAPR